MIASSEKVMKGLGNISYSAPAPITPGQRKAAIFCTIYTTHQSQYYDFFNNDYKSADNCFFFPR